MANIIMKYFRSVITLLVVLLLHTVAWSQGVPRSECFPFEELSADQRKAAEEMLLKAMDEAALYTIIGGLKPLSTGIKTFQIPTSLPRISDDEAARTVTELGNKKADDLTADEKGRLNLANRTIERKDTLDSIANVRAFLAKWRCGDDIFADVYHFSQSFEGKRFLDVGIVNRASLSKMLTDKGRMFSRWGVTANSHPLDVIYAVEYDRSSARFGGYGYLFGYPDHAVEFFAKASDEEAFSGNFVEREFISIPTFARETNLFVYAVPKGYKMAEADIMLRDRARPILSEYQKRRGEYIGEGKKGVVELLRDWFCTSSGCSPANATVDN